MIAKYICRVFFATNSQKPTGTTENSLNTNQTNNKKFEYKIKLNKIKDPNYLMQIINQKHSLNQTNKMLNALVKGVAGINKSNFQTIFKKYSYYIEKIPTQNSYLEANRQQKLKYLGGVTQVYSKLGKLSGAHMIKSVNKVSDQIYNNLKSQFENKKNNQNCQLILNQLVKTILYISRYNQNKAFALLKRIQKHLIDQKWLIKIDVQTSLVYLQAMANLKYFNRLIVQTCVDALKEQIQFVSIDEIHQIIFALASSHYPINKKFVISIVKRIQKHLNKQIDPNSGQSFSKNQYSLRNNLKILSAISMIEQNMKLASAYLPQLNSIFHIEIQEIGAKYISIMSDKDIQVYCSILRRSCYYDKTIINTLIQQILSRKVKQLKQLDQKIMGIQDQSQLNDKQKSNKVRLISLNTICSALHTLAIFDHRSQNLIQYYIKLVHLFSKISLPQASLNLSQTNSKQMVKKDKKQLKKRENFSHFIHPKHYSRVIWSICVLGNKQQIAKIYPLLENLFIQNYNNQKNKPKTHQLLNFYYSYLLLKTFFPKNTLSFDKLMAQLKQRHLMSTISKTHYQVFKCFITAGIAALKQHNISNLMCDIFVPRYISQNAKIQVSNVVIDLHGPHHYLRNCDKIKGGGTLKKKILNNQGYLYQFISVYQWQLVTNKQKYLIQLMEIIAKKFGKPFNPQTLNKNQQKIQKNQQNGQQKQIVNFQEQKKIKQSYQDEEKTTKIDYQRKRGRKIRTNSLKLQNSLNNKTKII